MLAITMLMGLAWSLGITSSHFQLDGLVISFLVVHLLLSLVILVLRCIMDKQVRQHFSVLFTFSLELAYQCCEISNRKVNQTNDVHFVT